MLDMISRIGRFDDLWMQMMNQSSQSIDKICNKGISIIDKPHNIYSLRDKDGNVVGNKLEICTTPFKKDEVSVEILNGSLVIKCEKVEEADDTDNVSDIIEYEIHHGISSQSFTFTIKLAQKVDVNKITAKNEDGILTVTLPFKEEIAEEPKKITVL